MEMDSTDSFINVWMYVIDKPKKHSKSDTNVKIYYYQEIQNIDSHIVLM